MKFKIICYDTILHRDMHIYKTRDFNEALQIFTRECQKDEDFIDVRLYKGFFKITSRFMGNDYYKELKMMLESLAPEEEKRS